jgi:hypothetical protein
MLAKYGTFRPTLFCPLINNQRGQRTLNRYYICHNTKHNCCRSSATYPLITSATTLAGCHRKGGATLVHSWQSVTSFTLISLLIENFCHVPSSRTREWLPQIDHFNMFVLAHKNANEPAGFLPVWQKPSRTPAAVLWQM